MPKYHLNDIFDPGRAHPDEAHSVIMKLMPSKSRVLEFGCASGYLSGYMEQVLGCRVTGLEFDEDATAIAATRCSEVYTIDLDMPDALALAQNSAPYDVLLAAAVLEHLKYPERLLQQAFELLTPEAKVIVSLPNIAYWKCRLNLLLGRFDYTEYGVMDRTHLHMYTLQTGQALLEENGYLVEKLEIAGSGLQNTLNSFTRHLNRPQLSPILPNLFGYELIYVARRP